MEEIIYYRKKNKNKAEIWLIVALIVIIIAFSVFLFIRMTSLSLGTNPKQVLDKTHGEFILSYNKGEFFQEYYSLLKPAKERNLYLEYSQFKTNYSVEIPKLELDYRFYDYQKEYYGFCEGRRIVIDFLNPKHATFKFNYSDIIFNYELDLYPDLYNFSDNLKDQNCYFDDEKYTEGFLEDPYNNNFVDAVSRDFIQLKEKGFSDNEIVEIATLFVQSIPYGTDFTGLNRYPYETLYENKGNCLDKSLILVGILKNLGYTPYLILGHFKGDYHALVGVVCKEGNINYNEQEICFIETTIFSPIGLNEDIDIEQYLKISEGSKVYSEVDYGKNLLDYFENKSSNISNIEYQLNLIDSELINLEDEMCKTDCVFCLTGVLGQKFVDWEESKSITSCWDATDYNALVEEYNENVEDYNLLVQNWYKTYYDLEKSMFWNVEMLKRN